MAWYLSTPLPIPRRLTASVACLIKIQDVTMQKSTDGGDSTAIVVFAFSTRDNSAQGGELHGERRDGDRSHIVCLYL